MAQGFGLGSWVEDGDQSESQSSIAKFSLGVVNSWLRRIASAFVLINVVDR